MTGDKRLFEEAVEWARSHVRNMALKVPEQTPQEDAVALLSQDEMTFELTIQPMVAHHATRDSFTFDVLLSVAAACLRDHRRRPASLVGFAADVLDGTRKRPTKRGPQPRRLGRKHDTLALAAVVRIVTNRFDIAAYSSNDKVATAVRVVEQALNHEGHHLSHDAIKSAYQKLGELIR